MAKPDLCDRSLSFWGVCTCCIRPAFLYEEAQHLETAGLQKVELAVAGSEAEGLYRLLQGALSHSSASMAQPPVKRHQQPPTATVSKPSPQESEHIDLESSAPIAEGVCRSRRLLP